VVGDAEEAEALIDVFCRGREGPLQVGSVKTNMGHAEAASGLCGVIKVLLAFGNKKLPGNLHYSIPNPNIQPGKLRVSCDMSL